MSMPTRLEGADGNTVRVSRSGELVVSPIAYDETSFQELGEINTAYNFYPPIPKKQFIITGMLAIADRDIGTGNNSTVTIYEATDPNSLTIEREILKFEIARLQVITFTPIRVIVRKGYYINGQCDDDDVHINLTGYYLDALPNDGLSRLR